MSSLSGSALWFPLIHVMGAWHMLGCVDAHLSLLHHGPCPPTELDFWILAYTRVFFPLPLFFPLLLFFLISYFLFLNIKTFWKVHDVNRQLDKKQLGEKFWPRAPKPSWNPGLGRQRQEDLEFKAGPDYIMRTCFLPSPQSKYSTHHLQPAAQSNHESGLTSF